MEFKREKYERLLAFASTLPPLPTAVAHPCDHDSLSSIIEAARLGLVAPILVASRSKLEAVASECNLDLGDLPIIDVPHSHAAAEVAVQLVHEGRAEALMKGSLHTDELMGAVVTRNGLRTGRRVSHCFVMDVPGRENALIITDAAALCKMADRQQITGGILDGPLALDNAISEEAARIKGIESPVAGRANVLVVPDLESGNLLAKSLSFLAGADAAGIVLGAKVPIILTSRADSIMTRLASCAVASLVALARRENPSAAIV
ncbi:phosphate acyltransferase [Caballeronia sp. HLA56]